MQSIEIENMPGTSIEVIETSTVGYIVGVIHIDESLLVERTDEANTYVDWHQRFAAGGHGMSNLLMQLWYAASDIRSECQHHDSSEDQAKVEFLDSLMDELAGLRQGEYSAVAAQGTR